MHASERKKRARRKGRADVQEVAKVLHALCDQRIERTVLVEEGLMEGRGKLDKGLVSEEAHTDM